jgi:hypothetical protein
MSRRLVRLATCAALALAGCASNQETAARRCSAVSGPGDAHDQCVARELERMAKFQAPPRASGSGGY